MMFAVNCSQLSLPGPPSHFGPSGSIQELRSIHFRSIARSTRSKATRHSIRRDKSSRRDASWEDATQILVPLSFLTTNLWLSQITDAWTSAVNVWLMRVVVFSEVQNSTNTCIIQTSSYKTVFALSNNHNACTHIRCQNSIFMINCARTCFAFVWRCAHV